MRVGPLVVVLLGGFVLAGDPARLPEKLRVERSAVSVQLDLQTTWTSSDHKLRFLSDNAHLAATLDVAPEDRLLVATPKAVDVTRKRKARVSGFFSDDETDAKGEAHWKEGAPNAPPPWRMLVSPRGEATAEVGSASPIWHLEGWLNAADARADEEARLRRLVHYTDLGFFGAPPLTGTERFEASFVLELGESGLTNHLVLVEAVYDLRVSPEGAGLRVAGPLERVKLLRGEGVGDKTPDRWLDVAFARGGPDAKGELSALLEEGSWREVRQTLSLEHRGRFDGGTGRATFTRTLSARWK